MVGRDDADTVNNVDNVDSYTLLLEAKRLGDAVIAI